MTDRPNPAPGSFPQPQFHVEPRPSRPDPMSGEGKEEEPERDWRTNAVLFALTVVSVFYIGGFHWGRSEEPTAFQQLLSGWVFGVPLLAILVCHEFGHWIAAKLHGVDASLPYFIPLPILNPFGTLGAVIAFRGRIRSRNALLDIGAAGPLAGLVVALPILAYGLTLSEVEPMTTDAPYIQEGQSLLYMAMKWLVVGPIPEGHDVMLHPTALAAWVGLLLTMINMLPWGQLDGGHVAYALLGDRHTRIAKYIRPMLLPLFVYNAFLFFPMLSAPVPEGFPAWVVRLVAVSNAAFWLVWFAVLGFIGRVSGSPQGEHPPTEPGPLTPGRKIVAGITLATFPLLFMPTPWAQHFPVP